MKLSFLSFLSLVIGTFAEDRRLRTKQGQENDSFAVFDTEAHNRLRKLAERLCDTPEELNCRNGCYNDKTCGNGEMCKRECRQLCCTSDPSPAPVPPVPEPPTVVNVTPFPMTTLVPVPPVPAPAFKEEDDERKDQVSDFRDRRLALKCYRNYKWHSSNYKNTKWYKKERCHSAGWCPTYRGCYEGADIRLRDCGESKRKKYQYWDKRDGLLCASRCPEYCVTMGKFDGDRIGAVLTKKKRNKLDWFAHDKGYEIQRKGLCFTMHHMPIYGEPMKFDSCDLARWSNSNDWEIE